MATLWKADRRSTTHVKFLEEQPSTPYYLAFFRFRKKFFVDLFICTDASFSLASGETALRYTLSIHACFHRPLVPCMEPTQRSEGTIWNQWKMFFLQIIALFDSHFSTAALKLLKLRPCCSRFVESPKSTPIFTLWIASELKLDLTYIRDLHSLCVLTFFGSHLFTYPRTYFIPCYSPLSNWSEFWAVRTVEAYNRWPNWCPAST